jgi:diacylglycerol O-acyltransferase / wax synthase
VEGSERGDHTGRPGAGGAAERLTVADGAFVTFERPGLPMHVGSLAVYDPSPRPKGPIRLVELRQHVASRLPRLPRFRQRLATSALDLGRPSWIDEPRVQLSRHVLGRRLARGAGWDDLLALVGRLHSEPLDRKRPLWRMVLVDGLPEGRQAVVTLTHHAITDGLAGLDVAEAILEPAAGTGSAPTLPPAGFSAPRPAVGLTDGLRAALGAGHYLATGPLAFPGPFNGQVGPERALATADLPRGAVLEVKRHLGGTVDDVALATVALAVGRRLQRRAQAPVPERLRTMVPVSTRSAEQAHDPGNRVSAFFVDLPLRVEPVDCVRQIATAKSLRRSWHEALGVQALVTGSALLPPLVGLTSRWLTVAPFSFTHLIVSDIPGPVDQLALLGAPLRAMYPLMPLAPGCGLSIALAALGPTVGVGLTADPGLVPDVGQLAEDIAPAFASLEDVAATLPHRR